MSQKKDAIVELMEQPINTNFGNWNTPWVMFQFEYAWFRLENGVLQKQAHSDGEIEDISFDNAATDVNVRRFVIIGNYLTLLASTRW